MKKQYFNGLMFFLLVLLLFYAQWCFSEHVHCQFLHVVILFLRPIKIVHLAVT